MNNIAKSTIGVSLAGLFVLFATHGAQFFDAANAAWLFLLKLSEGAPLGLSSFLLAITLGSVSQPFLRHWLPAMPCKMSREFVAEFAALVIGVVVMWEQTHTLNGLLLGLLAGFASPLVYKGIAAACALTWRAVSGGKP